MRLGDLYKDLAYGELVNLSLAEDTPGEINVAARDKILSYVNQGLKDLSTKFVLSEKEIRVRLYDNISDYELSEEHADSNTTPDVPKYIEDSELNPFTGDIIRILTVFDEIGHEFHLNRPDEPASLFTPAYNVIQIPYWHPSDIMAVIYQAGIPRIETYDAEAEVDLPVFMEEPLRAFVGYKTYSNMNGVENSQKAQEFLGNYNSLLSFIKDQDLTGESRYHYNCKLKERGFA
jgi:hypothetical protein